MALTDRGLALAFLTVRVPAKGAVQRVFAVERLRPPAKGLQAALLRDPLSLRPFFSSRPSSQHHRPTLLRPPPTAPPPRKNQRCT